MQHELIVPGLDGANPLGFLAALGVLLVLSERAGPKPKLAWRNEGSWRPVLMQHDVATIQSLAGVLSKDLVGWENEPMLAFEYPKLEKLGVKMFAGLRPPLQIFRPWIRRLRDMNARRSLTYACALLSETAVEEMKEDKGLSAELLAQNGIPFDPEADSRLGLMPTHFDFTSRNAQFLDQLRHIRGQLTEEAFLAELEGRRSPLSGVRRMEWDPDSSVPGAIQSVATVPVRPAAEWLAFRGLACLPAFGVPGTLNVTACRGRRKNGRFVWPIWEGCLSSDVVQSVLGYPGWEDASTHVRRTAGVTAVYTASLSKAADGYSGRFEPSAVV